MACYAHLPIWKDAIDLAVHLEKAVWRFPRPPAGFPSFAFSPCRGVS